MNQVTRPEQ